MIEQTKQVVESEYSIVNGREYDARVIYGDTDSVMVKFGYSDLETTMALGKLVKQAPNTVLYASRC